MAKTLGLDIVIGAAVAGAVNGFRSVLGEVNTLGSSIKKLNNEKLTILEATPEVKKFNDRLSTLNQTLDYLYKKKKDLQLKKALAKTDEEAKKINNELKKVNKSISVLNKQKLNLKEELEKTKEKVKKTNLEFRALNRTIEKLSNLKLKLQVNQLKREEFKSKVFDTIAIGATVSFPVKKAIEFESAMADVIKVANLDKLETIEISKALEKLSTKIPIAADGLAAIAASGAQLGISKDKLIDFTKVVAKMSTAFDMSAEEAGENIAKLMNVYHLGLNEVQSLGDAINYLSDNTAAKSRDLVNVLARIGGTAKMFGLSAKQAAALADAFLAMGKPPEVAATAINALLIKLQTADTQGKKFQDGLKALGLNAIDIKFKIKNNPQKAIMLVLERIKNLDKQIQMNILSNMFGAEYSDDIALLVSGLDNYKKAIDLTSDKSKYMNSMQREFENRSKTTANQLQLLGNALNRIAIDLGSVVLPVLKTFAEWGVKISNAIANFNQEFPILGKAITFGAVALGSFVVIGAGVGYFLTFITGGITRFRIALTLLSKWLKFNKIEMLLLDKANKIFNNTLTISKLKVTALTVAKKSWTIATNLLSKSMSILGGALRFVGSGLMFVRNIIKAHPIGFAITLIAAGAYLIYSNWDKLKSFFSTLWNGIKIIFTSAWEFIKSLISFSPLGIIVNNWTTIKNYFSNFWNWLSNKFNAGITFISNIFSSPVQTISSMWSSLANWFSGFWENIKGGFKNGVNTITGIFLHPINTIQNLWNKLLGWISKKIEWISSIGSKIKSFFGFGEDKEEKLTLKPVVEKVKPIVTATALATTTATATPQIQQIKPMAQIATIKPQTIKPIGAVKPINIPINTPQTVKNTQTTPQTIVYNFNFGDIKVETKDGKIANPEELKEQLKQIIEEINFENKQRSLGDVV